MSYQGQAETQAIENIRRVIRKRGDELRARYPFLQHQNLLGLLIFSFSAAGVVLCGMAYWQGYMPAWLCIVLVAMLTSLLHEIEHDLIHWQYFRRHKIIHHAMMLGVWLLRPGTINPWVRRHLHFLHHKTSGSQRDIEEVGIGNGRRYGVLRFWIMADTFLGNVVRTLVEGDTHYSRGMMLLRIIGANFPLGLATAFIWYGFLGFHSLNIGAALLGMDMQWSAGTQAYFAWADKFVVVLIAPFYLRSFCLTFISSNMHYFGNVNSLLQQTQVLNAPLFWPFQLFCFNFGSTHGIHHFVVGEPFYIRQMTASAAHRVMRENGVKFNDLNTFARANRYAAAPEQNVQPDLTQGI